MANKATRQEKESLIAAIKAEAKRRGYSDTATKAVLGNVYGESGFNPHAINPSSKAYGAFQYLGTRLGALATRAGVKASDLRSGKAKVDVKDQVAFAFDEIDGVVPGKISGLRSSFKTRFNNTKDLTLATQMFAKEFERPSAKELRGSLAARVRAAKDYTSVIGGQSIETATPKAKPTRSLAEMAKDPNTVTDVIRGLTDVANGVAGQAQAPTGPSIRDMAFNNFDAAMPAMAKADRTRSAPEAAQQAQDAAQAESLARTAEALAPLSEFNMAPNARVDNAFEVFDYSGSSASADLPGALSALAAQVAGTPRGGTGNAVAVGAANPSLGESMQASPVNAAPTIDVVARSLAPLAEMTRPTTVTPASRVANAHSAMKSPQANARVAGAFDAVAPATPIERISNAFAEAFAQPRGNRGLNEALAQKANSARSATARSAFAGVDPSASMLDPGLMGFQTAFDTTLAANPATTYTGQAPANAQSMTGLSGLKTASQQVETAKKEKEKDNELIGGLNAGGFIGATVGGAFAGPLGAVAMGYLGNKLGDSFSNRGSAGDSTDTSGGGIGQAIGDFFNGIGGAIGGMFGGDGSGVGTDPVGNGMGRDPTTGRPY